MRGGPYTEAERAGLLTYCQSDVDALARLLPRMLPALDVERALLRGRYMTAVARMEFTGIPLDVEALDQLRRNWDSLKGRLVREIDRDYGVYVPADRPPIDTSTRFGAAAIEAARSLQVDPDALAEAVEYVHQLEKEAAADRLEAVRAARAATGLTVKKLNRLLDAGKDHPDLPGFDLQSRELAGSYPALGIGRGYDPDGVDEDYAPKLWEVLTQPDPTPLPKHHPDVIQRAADLLGPDACTGSTDRPLRFSSSRWGDYLRRKRIPWPRLPSGALALDDETFREMAKVYPAEIGPIRELRHTLGQMRLNSLAVGPDGRNRVMLSVFRSRTGRNQPSNTSFIFGPSVWLRSLIKPGPGRAVAYVDWSQQELGIAAALSSDRRMMDAYQGGDFYMEFARMAGAVPPSATKATHGRERDRFKTVALGVLYGLSGDGLARKFGEPPSRGRELLQLHQRTFRRFWEWSDAVEERAILTGKLRTVFGWALHVGTDVNPRSLRNWPMQSNGSEMMRIAAMLATERGITVCCPVHDAFVIEADAVRIEAEADRMADAMREASLAVLPGFPLKTDAKIVRYPDRFSDPRGERMWSTVGRLLATTPITGDTPSAGDTPLTGDTDPLSPVTPPPSLMSLSGGIPF